MIGFKKVKHYQINSIIVYKHSYYHFWYSPMFLQLNILLSRPSLMETSKLNGSQASGHYYSFYYYCSNYFANYMKLYAFTKKIHLNLFLTTLVENFIVIQHYLLELLLIYCYFLIMFINIRTVFYFFNNLCCLKLERLYYLNTNKKTFLNY